MSLTLYLEAVTTIPDLFIDYIEVRLTSGESASLNWDESEIYRNADGFGARYKGVYFGEEPANGRLDELHDMVITDIGLYSDTVPETQITVSKWNSSMTGEAWSFLRLKSVFREGGHVDEIVNIEKNWFPRYDPWHSRKGLNTVFTTFPGDCRKQPCRPDRPGKCRKARTAISGDGVDHDAGTFIVLCADGGIAIPDGP